MKYILLIAFTLILLSGCDPPSENTIDVTFKVLVKRQLQEGEKVYLAGNHKNLGEWQPDKVQLEPKDIFMEKTISFPANSELQFKITKGSWETEAVLPDGSVPGNYTIKPAKDTTVELTVQNWKDVIHKVEGQVTGEIRFHRNLTWEKLKPRDVLVWLPPDYDSDTDRRYPVMYAHDGQNLVDPKTSFKGIDWQIDETADTLIRSGAIQPFLLVAIYNTSDRNEEYSKTPLGESYMDFIVTKLKPMMDEIYRTKSEKENTATMGSSMGGLIAFMLGWEKNEVFGHAACLSAAFQIQNMNYVKAVNSFKGDKKSIDLYLDNGTQGLESQLQPGIDEMMKALKNHHYSFEWFLDKGAEHDEEAWAKRVWRPLIQFFGNQG